MVYAGVEVDRCTECEGIWFDENEAEYLKTVAGSEHLDVGDPEIGSQLDRLDSELLCPRCGTAMVRMVDVDKHMLWYEKCPSCHGLWLDAGEFKKFKRNFPGRGVLEWMRNPRRFPQRRDPKSNPE